MRRRAVCPVPKNPTPLSVLQDTVLRAEASFAPVEKNHGYGRVGRSRQVMLDLPHSGLKVVANIHSKHIVHLFIMTAFLFCWQTNLIRFEVAECKIVYRS